MEVAKFAAPPNLEVRFVSCNESAIKRWLSSELEETVFSLTHELFMSKHHTVTLSAAYSIPTCFAACPSKLSFEAYNSDPGLVLLCLIFRKMFELT